MPWPKTGTTQLVLSGKGREIKWLVVCNDWNLEPLDLLNSLALGCYQQSPEVLILLNEQTKQNIESNRVAYKQTTYNVTCTLYAWVRVCVLLSS